MNLENLFLFLLVALLLVVACELAHSAGRMSALEKAAEIERMATRLADAVDDLDKWCGHSSPHARLIAKHLTAIGLGHAINAGTPCGDEPCTIAGLREQLRRLDATKEATCQKP